jgi:hypothetical protein
MQPEENEELDPKELSEQDQPEEGSTPAEAAARRRQMKSVEGGGEGGGPASDLASVPGGPSAEAAATQKEKAKPEKPDLKVLPGGGGGQANQSPGSKFKAAFTKKRLSIGGAIATLLVTAVIGFFAFLPLKIEMLMKRELLTLLST